MTTELDTTGEAAWLQWRSEGIGASDVAKAFTRSYGATPLSLVSEKLGRTVEEPDADRQFRFDRGHALEGTVARATAALLRLHVSGMGEQAWVERDGKPWQRATIDEFLLARPADPLWDAVAPLEIKTTERPNWDYYSTQVQWQMLVCGKPSAVVAVLVLRDDGGQSLHLRQYDADPVFQAQLEEFAEGLWAHIQAGTLPPAETVDDAKQIHPFTVDMGAKVEVPAGLVGRLRHAQQLAETATAELEAVKAEIASAIGDAEEAVCDGHTVATWRNQTARRLDQKALAKAHPELVEQYRVETESRVFRLAKPKGE